MRTLAVLSTTALVALAGCGGSDKSSSGTTSTTRGYTDDAAAVTKTVKDYLAAMAADDGEKACAFFTEESQKGIAASAGGSCPDYVHSTVKITGGDVYKAATLSTPKVNGSKATIHFAGEVNGQKLDVDQALTKVGDVWKLDAAKAG